VSPHPDPWLIELRTRMIEAGYARRQVDDEIDKAMSRFGTAQITAFLPILVERAVERALRNAA
jgi:hypothetical protein